MKHNLRIISKQTNLIKMAKINFNNAQKEYRSIEETVEDMYESIRQMNVSYQDTSELGIYKIFHEMMENYVKKESPGPEYTDAARNEFVDKAVKTLNLLGKNAEFQEDYKLRLYKEVKP